MIDNKYGVFCRAAGAALLQEAALQLIRQHTIHHHAACTSAITSSAYPARRPHRHRGQAKGQAGNSSSGQDRQKYRPCKPYRTPFRGSVSEQATRYRQQEPRSAAPLALAAQSPAVTATLRPAPAGRVGQQQIQHNDPAQASSTVLTTTQAAADQRAVIVIPIFDDTAHKQQRRGCRVPQDISRRMGGFVCRIVTLGWRGCAGRFHLPRLRPCGQRDAVIHRAYLTAPARRTALRNWAG